MTSFTTQSGMVHYRKKLIVVIAVCLGIFCAASCTDRPNTCVDRIEIPTYAYKCPDTYKIPHETKPCCKNIIEWKPINNTWIKEEKISCVDQIAIESFYFDESFSSDEIKEEWMNFRKLIFIPWSIGYISLTIILISFIPKYDYCDIICPSNASIGHGMGIIYIPIIIGYILITWWVGLTVFPNYLTTRFCH